MAQAWALIRSCRWQVRLGFGGAVALDYGAVLAMADALAVPRWLVAELLPDVEVAIIAGLRGPADPDSTPEEETYA